MMWMWKMDGCEGKKREESGVGRGFYLLDRTPRTSRHVTSRDGKSSRVLAL